MTTTEQGQGHGGNQGHHGHEFEIVVNGQEITVPDKTVTFEQIVALAFPEFVGNPDYIFTVSYSKSDHEHKPAGVLHEGESVKVKDGTIFDVTATNKS
jgi:hypothetical protein